MAEQEVVNILKQIANQLNQQNGGGYFSQQSADFGKQNNPRDETARAKEAAKIMSSEVSGSVKEGLKSLPKELSKAIDGSSSKLAKEIAGGAKKIQDVLRVEDQVTAMRQISNGLKEIGDKTFKSQEDLDAELQKLEDIATASGLSLEQLGVKSTIVTDEFEDLTYVIKDSENVVKDMNDAVEETTDALEAAKEETQRMERSTAKATSRLLKLWAAIKPGIDIYRQEVALGVQRATADAGQIKGITALGISQLEYAKILAETRQEQFAMQSAGVNFQEQLTKNADRLKDLTGSNAEAAQVQQMLIKNASRMGVSQGKLGDAIGDQITAYEKNARAYGMSAMEVAKLTENLMEDDNFRMEMVRLKESERKQFVLGIAARQKEFKMMGFTAERAKALQKTFADLAGMNPRERMKQAAKKRAMMGALGMGAEGARLMDLELRYQYETDPEKKAKMQGEMTQIQSKASNKFLEKTGAGASLGSAMQWAQMAEKTGFKKVVDVFETKSGEGLKHQADTAQNTNEINQKLKDLKKIWDTVDAVKTSGIGAMGMGVGGLVAGAAAPKIGKSLFGKMFGGGKDVADDVVKATSKSSMGKLIGKIGAPVAALMAGYSKNEELKDRTDLTTAQKATQVGSTAVGAGGGALGGAAGGAALGTMLLPGVGTIIGGLIGGAFGAWGGGALGEVVGEVGSDLMSDPEQIEKVEKRGKQSNAAKEQAVARKSAITRDKERLKAILEQNELNKQLITYLKEVNGANTELAQSVNKTAEVGEATLRINGIPERRASF